MATPKVLVWDIETSFMMYTGFTLWPDAINHKNIIEDWHIICASWMWLDGKRVYSAKVDPEDPHNDRAVVEKLHEVINEADAVVHHNGDKFDIKKLVWRVMMHDLPPLNPVLQDDTLKMLQQVASPSSKRLDFLGKEFGMGGKHETPPGLWMRCLAGEKKAIDEMVAYNRRDVQLLKDVYLKLRPHCKSKINMNVFKGTDCLCPQCGSPDTMRNGKRPTLAGVMQKWQCKDCGNSFKKPVNGVARPI